MERMLPSIVTLLALSLCTSARPLFVRSENLAADDEEEGGPDGHLNSPWVVAVAVASVGVLATVAAIIIFIKWRQRRKARQTYARTVDELAGSGLPGQPYAWKGPYASRSSYNRSPSPVSLYITVRFGAACSSHVILARCSPSLREIEMGVPATVNLMDLCLVFLARRSRVSGEIMQSPAHGRESAAVLSPRRPRPDIGSHPLSPLQARSTANPLRRCLIASAKDVCPAILGRAHRSPRALDMTAQQAPTPITML
ncbi:hypothetical protein C8Q80DRAFT_738637 [Daedaleopsis nitida]|nr:hypothetical protein C8Q80DRAFT_738637 [Daedaleopsis nitida]